MKMLDRVFLTFYSRRRRKMGDARLESAWRGASFFVSTSLALPSAAIGLVLMASFMLLINMGFTPELKRTWQIAAGCFGVLTGVVLDRRFKKYLSNPPALAPTESGEERAFARCYLMLTIAAFAAGCIGAALIYGTWKRT